MNLYFIIRLRELVVNSVFRVHPISAGHQTEVPINTIIRQILWLCSTGKYITWRKFQYRMVSNNRRRHDLIREWYIIFIICWTPIFNFGDPSPLIDRSGRSINSYITFRSDGSILVNQITESTGQLQLLSRSWLQVLIKIYPLRTMLLSSCILRKELHSLYRIRRSKC